VRAFLARSLPVLDVHILTLPTSDPVRFRECINSVFCAVERARFEVRVRVVEGVQGHIGQGRAAAYAQGYFPYVTCVDDDDWVLPHAFRAMKEALSNGDALAISTPERIERNGCMSDGKQRHHLIAYRRDVIIDHADWPCCGDVAQMAAIPEDAWIDLLEPQYVHRVYESPARLMRRANQDELNRALAYDQLGIAT
jgi:hypothetical protein